MKERPILFSAPMVRALLAGTKTQTRRLVKPQPSENWSPYTYSWVHAMERGEPNPDKIIGWGPSNHDGSEAYPCRYGKPGDRLWVKETFAVRGLQKYHYTGNPDDHGGPNDPCCAYAADATYKCGKRVPAESLADGSNKWKSSMLMPRKLSRLTLEIVKVRVERLHKISRADVFAEGVPLFQVEKMEKFFHKQDAAPLAYGELWNEINGKTHPWSSNPWVWVVEFQIVTKSSKRLNPPHPASR